MTYTYENGAILVRGAYHERALYHVSNEKISACFDGTGALVYYAKANGQSYCDTGYAYLYVDGRPLDPRAEKTVRMIGRRQEVRVTTPAGTVSVTGFLTPSDNGVFFAYRLESNGRPATVEFAFSVRQEDDVRVGACGAVTFTPENRMVAATLTPDRPTASVFVSYDKATPVCSETADFARAQAACDAEIAAVPVPAGLTEEEKACYFSSYFCALENYKEEGDYRAFMAGCRYLLPMRSYYRDSYFTVLPMYNGQADKVRAQILTLARGISEDGNCPSAVRSDYSAWWGNHYDSPSFLSMMLSDYVRATGDETILAERVCGETVLGKARSALDRLAAFADETGLLYKDGRFNRRDWADEVNRPGYVTYDEILFARANACLSDLYARIGDAETANTYRAAFARVREAINRELWDDARGYYVNYRYGDETESNLSVDTVFAALFGIADDARARRMLENMEKRLEVKHNPEMGGEDFGVMSVYPCYEKLGSAYWKSAQPYNYHNGANWPYLTAMYALAKRRYGLPWRAILTEWFTYNTARGNYTPVEYFSPYCEDGSLLQAWSAATAFVLDEKTSSGFFDL